MVIICILKYLLLSLSGFQTNLLNNFICILHGHMLLQTPFLFSKKNGDLGLSSHFCHWSVKFLVASAAFSSLVLQRSSRPFNTTADRLISSSCSSYFASLPSTTIVCWSSFVSRSDSLPLRHELGPFLILGFAFQTRMYLHHQHLQFSCKIAFLIGQHLIGIQQRFFTNRQCLNASLVKVFHFRACILSSGGVFFPELEGVR